MNKKCRSLLLLLVIVFSGAAGRAQDTLRVMAYNVLYFGNGCQGPNGYFHDFLKTIVGYTGPDILSMEKMASIPLSPDDKYGTAPVGFADSILNFALNAAYPGRYAYCPYTNNAKANNMAVLFYDKRKLGFVSIVSSYTNITDFNTYKLYYKDPALDHTHDTTFIYITPNHAKSGDEFEAVRGRQIAEEMSIFKKHFTRLPNMIDMGDFNVRNSSEACYQALTGDKDTSFRFYDPPFYPDHALSYPADWDHNPMFAQYLTTATRQQETSCGSGGGAKNWYDHIFLSSWIVNNTDHVWYIPHSYHTVGNDGNRFRVAINNSNITANNSAPADVINALWHMSNKYPVMLSLLVTSGGVHRPANPEIPAPVIAKEQISVVSPVDGELDISFPENIVGEDIIMQCLDEHGTVKMEKKFRLRKTGMHVKCSLDKGNYTVRFSTPHNIISEVAIVKR